MNIYEKMSAITQEISAVAKNLEVGFGQSKYKAVGEADVLAAVKPIEAKHGVYSYPLNREVIESAVLTSVNSKGEEKKNQFCRIETTYRFVNMEEPSEFIDVKTYGDGVDSQDKAPGKAMTYGDKYALLKAYKIITGDDPDQNYSEELKGKDIKKDPPKKKTDKERMESAYPPREEMIAFISQNYDDDNLAKILTYYEAVTLEDMTTEQLAVAYNRKKGAGQ